MLSHVPSYSSLAQGVLPGMHNHPGLNEVDERNLDMQEPLGHVEDEYREELEFEHMLEETMLEAFFSFNPLWTYMPHEEDQFQDTLNADLHRDPAPFPTYYSLWHTPEPAAPQYKMSK